MKRKRPPVQAAPAKDQSVPWRLAALAGAVALVIAFALYSPALHAPFFFDDNALNFRLGERVEPIQSALLSRRPVLSTSYWIDYQWSGDDPAGYRYVNLIIHSANTALVFLVLWRLLEFAGWTSERRRIAALLGAAVFLVHPLQTESVAYIAGRSESLCTLFMLTAFGLFLYRPAGPVSWPRAIAVLAAAGIAATTKENGVAIGGVLLLTDLFWGPGAGWKNIRANWRLYAPALAGGVVAGAAVARVLSQSQSAGAEATGIRWYQYGLTEARAIVTYLRMVVAPFGQSVDHDFPISRNPLDRGAIFYLLAIAGLALAAWLWRRRFPLAAFGFLMFLILLAPTSSVIPISDPLVERRMYLPLAGLILVACEAVSRWRPSQAVAGGAAAAVLLMLALFTYQRATLWGHTEQMWIDAAERSWNKSRPWLHLSEMLVLQNRCNEALAYLQKAEQRMPKDGLVQVGIAKGLECLGKRDEALARLEHAAAVMPSSGVYQWLGLLEGAMGRSNDAGAALRKAVELGPRSSEAHSALGLWYESVGNTAAAVAEYRETMKYNQYNPEAQAGLERLTGKPR